MESNVFIIHSEEDNNILEKLVSEYNDKVFGKTTLKVRFVDSCQPLQPFDDFGLKIRAEIESADCILAVITPNSLKSAWVNQEIGFTLGRNKPLLPIKKKSLSDRGCDFLHSDIDCQLVGRNQSNFPRIIFSLNRNTKRYPIEHLSKLLPNQR